MEDAVRTALVLKVQSEMLDTGCSLTDACERVGVTMRSYHRWVASDSQAMELVRDYLNEAQRNLLMTWSQSMAQILTNMIQAAMDPSTKLESRLKIIKYLEPYFENLGKVHHATPGGEDRAPFLKKGPTLHKAQSRLATLDISSTPEGGVRVDVLQDQPILDGHFEEQEDTPE